MTDLSAELAEIKALLHGLRMDVNHLAKANHIPLMTHDLKERAQKQRLSDLEAALDSVRKSQNLGYE
tara:strand:- start:747 stop:947 length:201 start_codon:yes stop_codon:yes gene_type:complete